MTLVFIILLEPFYIDGLVGIGIHIGVVEFCAGSVGIHLEHIIIIVITETNNNALD